MNFSRSARLGLAVAAGAALALAFPSFNAWPLAWISVAGLMLAAYGASVPFAALCGFIYGMTFYCVSVPWIYTVLRRYGPLPVWQALGVLLVLALLVGSLAFTASSLGSFAAQLRQMFGFMSEMVYPTNLTGFWAAHQAVFLLPVFAAFAALCASMALWPAQKNLGTLLGCSAAIMLAAQFVKGYEGGIYMAWYLPLLILTIFRPNLEDRVALSAISEGWTRRRKQ